MSEFDRSIQIIVKQKFDSKSLPRSYLNPGKLSTPIYDLKERKIVIPIYQRNYEWQVQNVSSLIDDIVSKFNKKESIWLGNILVSSDSDDSITLIDGQQRIMTMFLIFKELLDNFLITSIKDENPKAKIYENNFYSFRSSVLNDYLDPDNKINLEDEEFKHLLNIITKIKEKLNRFDSSFIDYLQQQVCCTVLIVGNNYEFFEDLNSKSVPLKLHEKCIAFLTGIYGKFAHPLFDEFIAKTKLLNFLTKSNIPNTDIIERFVDVSIVDDNRIIAKEDYFTHFKNIILKKGFDDFFVFLNQIQKFEEEDKNNFQKWYLWEVCKKDYWLIYVYAKIKFDNPKKFLNFFLDEVWKFDLIRHLYKIAKTSIKKDVINFVRDENFGEEGWHRLISKVMKSFNYSDKTKVAFKGSAKDISYDIPNFVSRFVYLFYLLYAENPLSKRVFSATFYNNYSNKETVDHLLPTSRVKDYSDPKIGNGSNLLKNLWLLKSEVNKRFNDIHIDKKIEIWSGSGTNVLLPNLENTVIKTWKEGIKLENLSRENQAKIINEFWDEREKDLDSKINKIRDEYLTINLTKLDIQKTSNDDKELIKEKVLKKIIKHLHLSSSTNIRGKKTFFSRVDSLSVFFSFFDFKGKKAGQKVRVQMSPSNFEWFRTQKRLLKKSKIIGFHISEEKFYEFVNWDKFFGFKRKSNASLHFNNNDWKEFRLPEEWEKN